MFFRFLRRSLRKQVSRKKEVTQFSELRYSVHKTATKHAKSENRMIKLQFSTTTQWFLNRKCLMNTTVTAKWHSKLAKTTKLPEYNGWFQKISIPYHGWHEYFNPPLPSEIPKCLSPPCPPNSKIANPPSPPEFSTFVSDPLEFLFVCLNLQTNEKLALFPSAKEFCSQFLVRRSSN